MNIEFIQWFLRFMQTDLESLIVYEYSLLVEYEFKKNIGYKYDRSIKELKELQSKLQYYYNNEIFGYNSTSFGMLWHYRLNLEDNIFKSDIEPAWPERVYDLIIIKLIKSLEGLAITTFKKCLECDKWFLHVTKKKKIYCSNKCASRHIVRKKRNNH